MQNRSTTSLASEMKPRSAHIDRGQLSRCRDSVDFLQMRRVPFEIVPLWLSHFSVNLLGFPDRQAKVWAGEVACSSGNLSKSQP